MHPSSLQSGNHRISTVRQSTFTLIESSVRDWLHTKNEDYRAYQDGSCAAIARDREWRLVLRLATGEELFRFGVRAGHLQSTYAFESDIRSAIHPNQWMIVLNGPAKNRENARGICDFALKWFGVILPTRINDDRCRCAMLE